jgi:hypothetical protein
MTAENAITFANLQTLRAEVSRLLAEFNSIEDWFSPESKALRPKIREAEEAVRAEVDRIRAAGFGGDGDFEFKVMGRMMRHHTDPVLPPCHEQSVHRNWRT